MIAASLMGTVRVPSVAMAATTAVAIADFIFGGPSEVTVRRAWGGMWGPEVTLGAGDGFLRECTVSLWGKVVAQASRLWLAACGQATTDFPTENCTGGNGCDVGSIVVVNPTIADDAKVGNEGAIEISSACTRDVGSSLGDVDGAPPGEIDDLMTGISWLPQREDRLHKWPRSRCRRLLRRPP